MGFFLVITGIVFPQRMYPQTPEPETDVPATTIPDVLRRPIRGEAPRYPRDRIIGELGQGTAPDSAWQYANALMSAVVSGNRTGLETGAGGLLDSILTRYLTSLETVSPGNYHLGGGRTEADGAVSFLVRFIGRDQWITGELYLLPDREKWLLDDLILEEERDIGEGKNSYPYDFTPYERFF